MRPILHCGYNLRLLRQVSLAGYEAYTQSREIWADTEIFRDGHKLADNLHHLRSDHFI